MGSNMETNQLVDRLARALRDALRTLNDNGVAGAYVQEVGPGILADYEAWKSERS